MTCSRDVYIRRIHKKHAKLQQIQRLIHDIGEGYTYIAQKLGLSGRVLDLNDVHMVRRREVYT